MKQQNIPCAAAQKGEAMNVKKAADYSVMYRKLTEILARNLSQMDEIYAIGKAVSRQSSYRQISLTAQAFPRAMCAGCTIFIRSMKMTNCSSGWQ